MRSFILVAFGFTVLMSGFPSETCHAQSDGGIARLTSAAYQPDSPARENRLFSLQTGHYGFAYNCDREEDKRNHPSICWRSANADQLPKRMGCFKRVRHEVAQVSRRILDGMCDTGCCCSNCQQQAKPNCGCPSCLAESSVGESIEQTLVAKTVPASPAPATSQRSGLIRLTRVDSVAETVLGDEEILASDQQVESETIEYVKPPVAKAASALTAEAVTGAAPADSHRLGLLERLRIIQSLQASGTTKVKKF